MRVAIAGLGLVGGSLARVLSQAGHRVIGVDRQPQVARRALRARVVAAVADLEPAAVEAEVVVLAAPPQANLRLLARLARIAPAGRVITDVTGVKVPICRAAAHLGLTGFVGGHPMAGREHSGFAASSADLFRGRPWIVVPGAAPSRAVARVRSLARAAGARLLTMSAEEHDRAVAFLSHVPQVVAWALFEAAHKDPVTARHLDAAGPAFREMTRLARSPRRLWREILALNHTQVSHALRAVRAGLRGRVPPS